MARLSIPADDLVKVLQGVIAAQSAAHLMIVKSLVDAGALDGPGVLDAMERMADIADGVASDILAFHVASFQSYLEETTPPPPVTLTVIDGGAA